MTYCTPLTSIRLPRVPPQQKPLARSFTQPPDVPRLIGGACLAVCETPPVPPPPPWPGLWEDFGNALNGSVKWACTATPLKLGGNARTTSPWFLASELTKINKSAEPFSPSVIAVPRISG